MNNIKTILLTHYNRYPNSSLQDFCKLLYQNEFGCGHLVKDLSVCVDRIRAERETVDTASQQSCEDIGNGYCRIYLTGTDCSDELLGRIFYASAKRQTGSVDGFLAKTAELKALCKEGKLPFEPQAVDAFLSNWQQCGMPLFSHSDVYKAAYAPAYRVIEDKYVPFLNLFTKIETAVAKKRTIIAIDGRCGSGKTTLAAWMESVFDCTVIHMDDFFLPPALRTPDRLAEPGGNVHYERFSEEVVTGLKSGLPFSYGVFDCSKMAVTHSAQVDEPRLIIVEGSYSHHPKLGDYADCKLFCDIDPAVQKTRIIARNGEAMYRNFETRWIPMEERYFDAFHIRETCDQIIR